MLFIHGGAFDEVTCCGAKPLIGCGFLGWKHGWLLLLPKHWKSGAFCAIELTSCINLTMVMSHHFIAPYMVGTNGVKTLSSKFLFLLNPLRKRLIASLDARLYPAWTIKSSKLAIYLSMLGYLDFSYSSWVLPHSSWVESMNLSLNTCSNSSYTVGMLWCTGWSLLRLSIMLRTHKLTFSPLMSVRANVTC
jgi:hypothetical protein